MAPVSGVGTDPHIELSQAAQCGDYSTLDTILSFGKVEIRRPGPNGLSLMLLIVHGAGRDLKPAQHLQCAKRLIKAGAPLDEVDRTGRCALHWAVEYDKPELLEVMLRSGASKTILDEEMKEPLDIAVELSNIKCISIILRSCSKEELDSPNEEGFTWLMRAAASGNMEVCRELYNAGASPNIIEPKTGRTALHFCAEFDQAQSLITLLGCEGDPKIRDKDGRTVAHVAAESEAIGCLHVLIEACTLLIMEVADDSGKTPLMLACRHEHEQTVKALISKNINPMAKDYNGQTALHWCAKNTNGKCAKILCKYRIDLTKAKDNDSHTPLHLACIAGSEEVVNKLLEFGADTTTMDDEFHTPLHLATVSGNAGCIVLLAQSGADVNVTDANGAYPLHYAANMSRDIEKLPEDAPVPTPSGDKATSDLLFIDPSLRNRPREDAQKALESLLALLENGASVVVRDSSGAQPLFNAAREGNEAACRLLLDFEADVAAKDNHGRTALHVAAQEGHGDVLTTLLEVQNMACLDAVDDRGRTPLMYAAASGKTKCVELLLEASANPNHKDDKQISVAHCLASVGDVEGMKLLKAKSGNLSTASKSGTYPLHEAALAGKPDVMSYLVKQGVVMGVRDSSGITPLHCSIANDNPECCKILVENGDNINPVMRTKDMRYLTPLDYALINVRPNCAEYLAKNNALPGIIYTGVMVNRIRLAWRRFRRRKYGRSRPETPHTGNTPGKTTPTKLSRATTPQRSISQTSQHVLESTTPLKPGDTATGKPLANGNLPQLGAADTEKVKESASTRGALPGLASQQAVPVTSGKQRVSPAERRASPVDRRGSPGQRRASPLDNRASPVERREKENDEEAARRGSIVKYEGPNTGRQTPRSDLSPTESEATIGNLSIPNAGYILGNRLYEQRQSFQNVMGSNTDLTQDPEIRAVKVRRPSGPPLALAGPIAQPPPMSSEVVKTLNNFANTSILLPIPTTSFVPVVHDGKSEPSIPYRQPPPSSSKTNPTEYQMESTRGGASQGGQTTTTAYLGPASERSTKIRPISAGSGRSEGLCLEAPEDNMETESTIHEYEMTIPDTDPGNEEGHQVLEDKEPAEVEGESGNREIVDEECDENDTLTRQDNTEHDDQLDEFMRPQADGSEELEYEDYQMEDGRDSVEIEGEQEYTLEDNSPEQFEEMTSSHNRPAIEDEKDGDLEEFHREQEEEDEEEFQRGSTPNMETTDYLRDDLSTTDLIRAESGHELDEMLDPEYNALTLSSPHFNDDDECGEITLKEVIRDAFDTPYLRDYCHTPTGETDSEDDTEYEFCNESEDEISVAQHDSDPEDDEGFVILKPSSSSKRSSARNSAKRSESALTAEEKELSNIEKVHDLRLRLEQELQRTKMEEEMGHVSRARVSQEVETLARQSTRYRDELKSSLHNTENMYRNVDQYIGQAMEVNNDLEDFLSQASRGKKASRGHRVTGDNFKSFRQAKTYNTSMVQETSSNKDKMYFKRSVDKSIRSNSQTSLDGKEYLFTANRRLQTYEEWMMLKWQEMKEKSLQTVRWTPVRVEPPQNIDLTAPPPAKDVKILYREYDQSSGRINKVVATNPDGAKIEFRADPPSDGENKQVRKKSPYKSKARIVDPETAAAYKLPSYNFGGYDGQPSNYNRKPLKFHHPPSKTKKSRVIA
ncbi:protein phosphatase 1 regulatory subunit 12A-like isoform X4 [Bolinopsis microptera]|uniref:protein phosphatase 1 regulatory subunit 12A-like isoform X4 n=1 Tax=Bolinopsis microptera TaxID=2820187 RepID=UPI003078A644